MQELAVLCQHPGSILTLGRHCRWECCSTLQSALWRSHSCSSAEEPQKAGPLRCATNCTPRCCLCIPVHPSASRTPLGQESKHIRKSGVQHMSGFQCFRVPAFKKHAEKSLHPSCSE